MLGDGMTHLDNKKKNNNNSFVAAPATILTLTIIIVASSVTANAAATITHQPPVTTTTNEATSNNNSDSFLGSLFLTHEGERTTYNRINDTHIEVSFVGNATIMPPTATTTINATETGNAILNIQPNGVSLAQGQVFLLTQNDDDEAVQEENATATLVEINRIGPDGIGSATGVVFYDTNSTGQLAFLDNMIGIFQREISQDNYTIRTWEWKGGTLPFENSSSGDGATDTAVNQTTTVSTLLEE